MAKLDSFESLLKEVEDARTLDELSRAVMTISYAHGGSHRKVPMRKFFTLAHRKLDELNRLDDGLR